MVRVWLPGLDGGRHGGIFRLFKGAEDPQHSNATRHDLHEMLMITPLSVPSDGEGFADSMALNIVRKEWIKNIMRGELKRAGGDDRLRLDMMRAAAGQPPKPA